jgi:hypothetical protein
MARQFNGTNQALQSASAIDLSSTNVVTVSVWIKPTTWPASSTEVVVELSADATLQTDSFFFYHYNSTTQGTYLKGNVGDSDADYSPAHTAGTWQHYVLIYDMSLSTNEVDMYFNGSLETPDIRNTNNNNTGNFGNRILNFMARNATSNWRDGEIADIAIWKSRLSAGNISSLAGGTLASAISPAPDFYWKICGDTSPEPATLGGISLNLVGSPTKVDHPATISGSCTAPPADPYLGLRSVIGAPMFGGAS